MTPRSALPDAAPAPGRLARAPRLSPVREPHEGADPLLAACRLVGGGEIVFLPPRAEGGGAHTLDEICVASQVRHRRVRLRGGWWRRDHGPLLAFRRDDAHGRGAPVALLPRGPRAYELADPADGSRTRVDAEVAATLAPDAFVFHAPLPRRALGPRDLLRRVLRGSRRDLLVVALVGIAGAAVGLVVPLVVARVVGSAIPDRDAPQLAWLTAALFAAALSAALFQVVRAVAVLRVGARLDGSLQAAVFDHLLSLPVSFFRRFSVGDLHARAMGVESIRGLLSGSVVSAILSLAFSVFSFAILFHYSVLLACAATVLVGLLCAATLALARLQLRRQRTLHEAQGRVAALLFDLLGGIIKLRVAGAERRAAGRWEAAYAAQRRGEDAALRVANAQAVVSSVYGALVPLVLFAVAGLSAGSGLDVAGFLAFNAAFGQFQAAALAALSVAAQVMAAVPLYERMRPILATAPEVDERRAHAGELEGALELSHVSFRYGGEGAPVLDDVSLRVEPGEFVALVGPSGSGKSTCLRLLLGFERPDAGVVRFDGRDLATLDLHSVRRQLGVALQDGQPLVGTVLSTVAGGRHVTLDEVWRAARMVGLEEEIRELPMGMYTFINDSGTNFSGGQRQRMLIARAIVCRPRIVLLDEATSALDNRTQETVIRSLEQLRATRLVIAHRLSTIMNADRIYVLDAGRVAESGTYDELVRRDGVFKRMIERQTL